MEGIKETKEVIIGVNKVAVLLIKHLKDGFQVGQDAAAIVTSIMGNEDLKNALIQAALGVSSVPAEVKDLDASEVVELVMLQAQLVPEILGVLKE